MRVERPPLDAHVGNGIGIGETSVHRKLCCKQFRSVFRRPRQTNRDGSLSRCRPCAPNIGRKVVTSCDEIEESFVGLFPRQAKQVLVAGPSMLRHLCIPRVDR